jgi:outer membrane lipoprotein-sorting protein
MRCKVLAILVIASVFMPLQVFAQSESTGNKVFDTLRLRFANGELFHSQLNHSFIDSYTGDTLTTLGEVWIDKDRYKLSMRSGLVIVDGNTSHVYNSEKNQVIISPYNSDEDDYAPSRFLHGSLKEYTIKNGPNNGRNSIVVMTSQDPFALFSAIEIELDDKALPIRITAVDQSGNVIISRFSFGSFLKQDAQVFTLNYPKSAEIIDLRN